MINSFNIAEAERFIEALAGSSDAAVTWQLFSDRKSAENYFARVYHHPIGTAGIVGELKYRNAQGSGIFIMVNQGDGKGRAELNVVGTRALFVDDDNGTLLLASPELAALPPSMTVQSGHGQHHYWLLHPGEDIARFTPAQLALAAHFGTDPKVSDLARVMRVPGFWHMKDPEMPFLVELVQANPSRRFTIDEVLIAYGQPKVAPALVIRRPTSPTAKAASRRVVKQGAHSSPADKLSLVDARALLNLFPRLELVRWAVAKPNDVKREVWRGIGTNIAAIVVECPSVAREAEELFHRISEGYEGYSASETTRVFRNAIRSVETHGPMTFDTLIAEGLPEAACPRRDVGRSPIALVRTVLWKRRRG